MDRIPKQGTLTVDREEGDLLQIRLAGTWKISGTVPPIQDWLGALDSGTPVKGVAFDSKEIVAWDSALLTFLIKGLEHCKEREIPVDESGLPAGVQRLLALATAIPERKGARRTESSVPFLARVGDWALVMGLSARETLDFLGEACIALGRLLRGKAQYRRRDLMVILQDCGVGALPIVCLISALVGLILAFVGAVQLVMFGAQIYVASLVGIAMVRVMGAVMAGIIMAGRTGASFAAQLGTMQVNEEIDAFKTLGISPMEFLVLPRMIAMAVMMPLLCLFADLMGCLGGLIVGVFMLDLNFMEYYNMTVQSVSIYDFWIGLFHSFVFGILVALAGCLQGMKCGRSASAVGTAVTSAVVSGIVAIIVATAVITILCSVIGI